MTVDFPPEADTDFVEAINYYEDCEPGLGEDFSIEVYSAVQNVLSFPTTWPILDGDVRRYLTNRFPYAVLYSVEPDRVYILAVMHLHRDPDYWKHRR